MVSSIIGLVALAAAPLSIEKPRMEPLIAMPAINTTSDAANQVSPETRCTSDRRWCVFLSNQGDLNTTTVNVYNGQLPPGNADGRDNARDVGSYRVSHRADDLGSASLHIWPTIIRRPTLRIDGLPLDETISIGVISALSAGYSGGGAQSTSLQLYQLGPTMDGRIPDAGNFGIVLDVPLTGYKMIRACFGEEDDANRRGVCHDEYDFNATLKLGKTMPDGQPQIVYQSIATTTPGSSRLSEDNSKRKLSLSDIKPRRDRKCSYRRIYTFNGELGLYLTPKPEPDCLDYMVP
jgi:hypothetical protein